MAQLTRLGAYAGVIAAASMTIAPAQAAEIIPAGQTATIGYASAIHADFSKGGAFDSSTFEEEAETAEYRRRWRGRRGYRRGRVRGGDVLAGVLVLGGIAAIASAASNSNRRERENRRYDDRRDDRRVYDQRSNPRASNGSGIDNAVSQCLTEIERDVRVETVDGASRLAQGWTVSGTLFNGSGFTCQIGNDGRISSINYNGFSGDTYRGSDGAGTGQFSDDRYADARAAMRGDRAGQGYTSSADQSGTNGPQPAYPGGPLPGEALAE